MDSFDALGLAAVVNGKFLCVHGGISPEIFMCEDIEKVDRFREPPQHGLICDLLWCDPTEDAQGYVPNTFQYNDTRGCSYFFGHQACTEFLQRNKLACIIRAHEAQNEGFKCHTWGNEGFPQVITIFSAPNYCDVYNNKAGIIRFRDNNMNIQQFYDVGHPYHLPNYLDSFTWSMPFIAEKVTEMFLHLLQVTDTSKYEELSQAEEENLNKIIRKGGLDKYLMPDDLEKFAGQRKDSLGKVLDNKRQKRIDNENSLKGIDLNGEPIDKKELENMGDRNKKFHTIRRKDSINEKRPIFQ